MAEFIRATLLAGNGTLLVNNTFVEWASVQALRRATAIPTQADMLGSYVDLEIFYQYVWQEAGKYVEYRNNTAYLFVAEGMDELMVIAPPDFALPAGTLRLEALHRACREWLGV